MAKGVPGAYRKTRPDRSATLNWEKTVRVHSVRARFGARSALLWSCLHTPAARHAHSLEHFDPQRHATVDDDSVEPTHAHDAVQIGGCAPRLQNFLSRW